ncbi:MAG: FMN-binding negative transcriptional regulator [Rhodospirillales bacterium]|nr:FMN-binding negative transcriptional regulator [Rhodospirillales bacterium]MDE2575893.1 FMN-binding negative transcriptional regulator [Rhodospirillales bacterium]
MYLRPVFTETDIDRIAGLIAAHSFGVLVTQGAEGMTASHVPFVVGREAGGLVLTAHLAAANPQCAALAGGAALAIFGGPHAYIAPGWYATQPAVPTWDYAAVHVHGTLEPVDDEAGVTGILEALAKDDPMGFTVAGMPAKYRTAMFAGIRAFRLPAARIEAQWKMSQNRSPADRAGVITALRARGEEAVATLIEATLPTEG